MRAVCDGLTSTDHPRIDRVEHDLADKPVLDEPYFWVPLTDSKDGFEDSCQRRKRLRMEEDEDDDDDVGGDDDWRNDFIWRLT